MSEKTLKARLLMKNDTATNWAKAANFIPKAGEIIIYNENPPKIKIGNGKLNVSSLPFISSSVYVGDTAPTENYDLWVDTSTGSASVIYTQTEKDKLAGIEDGANNYTLPVASSTLGGVKTTTTAELDVLTAQGYAPVPIVDGIPYFMPVSMSENGGFPYLTVGNLDLNLPMGMSVGSETQPIYFLDGYPYETTYTLEASVPADAKFTDTTYTAGNSGITVSGQKIYNKGILSLAQGTTNGSIKYTIFNQQVNNIVESDLKIKGLDTAAYHPENYFVPATRTINGYDLSDDISLTAQDIGALYAEEGWATVQSHIILEATNTQDKAGLLIYAIDENSSFQVPVDLSYTISGNTISGGLSLNYIDTGASETTEHRIWAREEGISMENLYLVNPLSISSGGTGATTAAGARTNLGITPANIGAATSSHTHSYLPLSGGTITGAFNIKNGTRFSEMHFAPSFDSSYAGTISYDAGDTNKYGSSTRFFVRQYSVTTGSTSSSGMSNYESFWFPSTASGLTTSVDYTIFTTKNPPTASQVGALPLTGGTLTGSLTVNNNIYSKGALVSQTNNYPEVYFKNAAGVTLADLWVNTTTGSYAPVILRVHADASTSKDFTFGKDGTFGIPNRFSAVMGEIKSNDWPQLFFRNANGNNLAQFIIPTDNGSYSGLAVNVFSDASTHVEYKFNSDGTFVAPAGITTTGNYVSIKNNSYPQLTFSNASGADIGKFFVSTTNGSYAATKIRAYSSASAYYDFQFSGEGTFNAKEFQVTGGLAYLADYNSNAGVLGLGNTNYGDFTEISCEDDGSLSINDALRATVLQVDGTNDWPSMFFKCKSKTNPGVLLQASSNHGFGIYCYGSDLDTATTRYFEGYTFPTPATGLTANKSYTVYSEKNIIYSSSQPTGVKGAIWLKPV